ncbi:MAG: DUF2950 family protein, partial [Planctomycetota bacterium]|nr:DUF2950 family protein [Planctomycetota bacterium]
KKIMVWTVLMVALAVLLGCGSKPSVGSGRTALENGLGDLAKVISFKKTDGKLIEFMGMKGYELEYEAEIELLKDVAKDRSFTGGVVYVPYKKPTSQFDFIASMLPLHRRQGEKLRISGKINFEKSEKGWKGTAGGFTELASVSSAPVKTEIAGRGSKPNPYGKYINPDYPEYGIDLRPDGNLYPISPDSEIGGSLPYTIAGDILTIKGPDGSFSTATIKGNTLTFEDGDTLVKEGAATESEKAAARESNAPQIIKANETSANVSLKILISPQVMWYQGDIDGNGKKDYWTADVSCLYRMLRADGETEVAFISVDFARADAAPLPAIPNKIASLEGKPTPKNGYFFRAMTTDETGNPYNQNEVNGVKAANSSKYAFCAYPAEYGKTGRKTFIVNQEGSIYSKDTGGQAVLQWPASNPVTAGWQVED